MSVTFWGRVERYSWILSKTITSLAFSLILRRTSSCKDYWEGVKKLFFFREKNSQPSGLKVWFFDRKIGFLGPKTGFFRQDLWYIQLVPPSPYLVFFPGTFFYAFPKSHLVHRAVCMVAFLQCTHDIHWKWGNYRGLDCQYTFRGAICKGPQCLSIWLGGNACLQVHIAFINILLSSLWWIFTNLLIHHSALKLVLISAVVLLHPSNGDLVTCLVSNRGKSLRFCFQSS